MCVQQSYIKYKQHDIMIIIRIYQYSNFLFVILFSIIYKSNGRQHHGRNLIKGHNVKPSLIHADHIFHNRNKRFIRRYLIDDCEVSDWSEWSKCDAYCGQGHSQRSRTLFSHPVDMNVAKDGPKLKEIKSCIAQSCETVCKATDWSEWNACSATCGVGTRTKSRSTADEMQHPMCTRLQLTKYDKCTVAPCEKINCNNLKWAGWSACEPSCGHGQQKRHRDGQEHSHRCKPDIRSCKSKECNRDCEVSEWEEWGECDLMCEQRRTRVKLHSSSGTGISCESMQFVEVTDCTEICEPCRHTEWSDWSSCSVDLACQKGTRVRIRNRRVIVDAGTNCIERMQKEYKDCTATVGCNKDCVYSDWSDWSQCVDCKTDSLSVRLRNVLHESAGDGKPCSAAPIKEERKCSNSVVCKKAEERNTDMINKKATKRKKTDDKLLYDSKKEKKREIEQEQHFSTPDMGKRYEDEKRTQIGGINSSFRNYPLVFLVVTTLSALLIRST